MPSNDTYDLIIIGGGPGGLSAAIYGARGKLKTLVIDKNPMAGALGKAEVIENYPGIPDLIPGPDLLALLKTQAEKFGAEFVTGTVSGVNFKSEPKEVMTNEGSYYGKAVVIATGAMGRKPSIPGEADFIGRGVSYCATCDAPFFRDKVTAAVGNIDIMKDELEAITKFVSNIYVISPAKELTPEQEPVIRDNPKIELLLSHRLKEIKGDVVVNEITVSANDGSERTLEVQGVFMYLTGAKPIVDFLLGAVELSPEGCIDADPKDMSTSVPGVYAIGDVTCKQVRQVVVATAEGCIAALSAEKYINDRKKTKSQWG